MVIDLLFQIGRRLGAILILHGRFELRHLLRDELRLLFSVGLLGLQLGHFRSVLLIGKVRIG